MSLAFAELTEIFHRWGLCLSLSGLRSVDAFIDIIYHSMIGITKMSVSVEIDS